MKIFLDANILVSVLNKEYPTFSYSSRLLSIPQKFKGFEFYTSPICLAIAYYFAEKKSKSVLAKKKIDLLCQHIQIAENSLLGVQNTLKNKAIYDFEDGLEYYAAMEKDCKCIITEDQNDFYFSEIEVLNCKDFFIKYLMK